MAMCGNLSTISPEEESQPPIMSSRVQPIISTHGEESGTVGWLLYSGLAVLSVCLFLLVLLTFLRQCRRKEGLKRGDIEGKGLFTWSRRVHRPSENSEQPCVMISHSLPDLTRSVSEEQLLATQESKKVARQTTLPTVPARHENFQRQLSHTLHLQTVPFSVCSLGQINKLGQLKPELYRNELVRQHSVESECSDVETAGTISFSLKFDPEIEGLFVKILKASNLPIKDVFGSADPYVKVYLLPDRKKKFVTKVHRRNLNPMFNETFVFSTTWTDLENRTLQFNVYDFDRFSRNDLIGQVLVRNLWHHCQPGVEFDYTMDIFAHKQDTKDYGEMMLSLCYLPTAGRLTVTIIKMRNLRALDITGSSDPFVKVILMCQGKRIKKKKTSIKKATLNPAYNESLVFDVPSENVDDVVLLFKVIDYDRLGANELLGVVVAGSSVPGLGGTHWQEMLENPRRNVTQWHPLQESAPPNLPSSPAAISQQASDNP